MGNKMLVPAKVKKLIQKLYVFHVKSVYSNRQDHFILQYSQSNSIVQTDTCTSLDKRRVIFVSLIDLFATWNSCPPHVLYSAIFVLPLKNKWIRFPDKYKMEIKNNFTECGLRYQDSNKFIDLLKWKDSQGLVFWMLDDYNLKSSETKIDPLIDSFWYYVSKKLMGLYDPVTQQTYKGLHFEKHWWRNTYNIDKNYPSLYDTKVASILSEYYFLQMKYKTIQEILHQSNPKSFNLRIMCNTHAGSNINKMIKTKSIKSMFATTDTDTPKVDDEWFISEDYDPNEN